MKNLKVYLIIIVCVMGFSQTGLSREGDLSYDFGLSVGSLGTVSYTEFNFGLNYFIKDKIIWRNSIFSRSFSEQYEDIYGLDSSARFYYVNDFSNSSRLTLYAGPGVRLVSAGDTVPFAEGGFDIKLGGFNFGLGAKTFFNKMVNKDSENDTLFFISLSGSGRVGD